METINQAAAKALQSVRHASPERETKPTQDAPTPIRAAAMRRFWERMAAIYGSRWTAAYGERCDDENGALTIAGDTWQRGLSGVGEQRIGTGLNACITAADAWPPTLPAFRAMCFAIPSLPAIMRAIRGKTEQTPFSRMVWGNLDTFRLKQVDADKAERMIRDAYELAREYVMAGGLLGDEPIGSIEAKPEDVHPATPETARTHLDKIADLLRTEPVKPHTEVDA